jgi:hypothetical protein
MKRGITVKLYVVKLSKKSLITRLAAAGNDIRKVNPRNPTRIMQ